MGLITCASHWRGKMTDGVVPRPPDLDLLAMLQAQPMARVAKQQVTTVTVAQALPSATIK